MTRGGSAGGLRGLDDTGFRRDAWNAGCILRAGGNLSLTTLGLMICSMTYTWEPICGTQCGEVDHVMATILPAQFGIPEQESDVNLPNADFGQPSESELPMPPARLGGHDTDGPEQTVPPHPSPDWGTMEARNCQRHTWWWNCPGSCE